MVRLTYEYVYNYFEEQGCALLEKEYINASTPMKYKCECGNISYIRFDCFKNRDQRCIKCGGTEKLTFTFVYNFFKEYGCELLENDYKNAHTKMKYKCNCGNIAYIDFDHFKRGCRCMNCTENEKLTYEFVYNYFKNYGCELLEKIYINSNTKMKYYCSCGNESYISWDNFKQGKRCTACSESHGEKQIATYLINHNCQFKREYKFKDCKNKQPLPFDFAIFDKNNNLQFLTEYDGQLHYISKEHFGGEAELIKRQINDSIKTNYCLQNNIPLLRIPYWDFDNIEHILDNFLSNFNQIETKQDNIINF
jgi:hypothetical protein